MTAKAGLQVGFGELIGSETLAQVKAQKFEIARIDCQEQSNERTTAQAQEVIDSGLQPLVIIRRAEQMRVLPAGALVELGNEVDIEKPVFPREKYLPEARLCVAIALETGQRLYLGVVSNPHKRGLKFLKSLPWREWPNTIGASFHWYPNGHSRTRGHDGLSRDAEVDAVRSIVGYGRPLIVSETGFSITEWTESEQAANLAAERRFWSAHDIEAVIVYQINSGPRATVEDQYGLRRFGGSSWRPAAAAFTGAVPTPVPISPVTPTRPETTTMTGVPVQFKTHDGTHYLCAESGGGREVVADRPRPDQDPKAVPGEWETFRVADLGNNKCSIQAHNGKFVSAQQDGSVLANRPLPTQDPNDMPDTWERWTYVERNGRVAFKSAHGKYLCAEGGGGGVVVANRPKPDQDPQDVPAEWEFFKPSQWLGLKVPVTARPLVGPLRVENKLFRDDTGYRRVLFCSWFPALRILKDNPQEFERQIDAIATAGYQGFRTFFAVGGWTPYWDGREVAPITFQKWHHSPASGLHRPASLGATIQAWPDFDDLLRTLLHACKARGLRLHQAVGDMQIICPDSAGKPKELELNRRFARICAQEGGLEVMALVGDTNEYPQNHYASDSPESIEQMGRILRIWEEEIPGVLTTMGSAITEEPVGLHQSVTHGKVCAVHTSRGVPTALKRTHALVHWEGAYRSFPKPYWQGEPMGWGAAVSGDRFTNNADGVALYAMHALTGQASNYFNGPAIHSREPLESTWGFRELPALFAKVLPEDVATWEHGNNGRGIEYWWKGKDFATATYKDWDTSPPKPIAEWTLYAGDDVVRGTGTPPRVSGLIVGTFT